jgi:hypothetical protein
MTKGAKVALIAIPLIGVGAWLLLKQPKVTIFINSDNTGGAKLGWKEVSFGANEGVVVSHLGWTLQASPKDYTLSHFGKMIDSGSITGNNLGTNRVQIIYNR